MPSDPTTEQVELRRKGRQRLIGAIALALIAVVFVPMLLDPEPRRARVEPVLAIPPRGDVPAQSAPVAVLEPATPAPAAAAPAPQAASTESPAASTRAELPPATAVVATPAPKPVESKSPAPKSAPSTRSEPKLEGFAVQVGAFKDEAMLGQARQKLVAARQPYFTERMDAASGGLTRLRAGPFPTREAADKAAAQLKGRGLDARVVSLP